MSDALERPALYYPYIHIRSEHWLKATLLCVPAVKRIVPETYTPEDLQHIIRYTQIKGRNGALLQTVPAFSPEADQAQQRLLNRLKEHEGEIQQKYQRSQAPTPDEYWIHDAKFNADLLRYLVEHNLAWTSRDPGAYGYRTWYALHPTLGSAIMTTLGLSIAREQGYDIVTPSAQFHETLLATKEDAIFDTLLTTEKSRLIPATAQTRHDLGQLVISLTGINYEALRPEDIPELQASKNFRKFQRLIRTVAQKIDRDEDPKAYRAQLETEAREIIDTWHETKSDLGSSIRDVLFQGSLTTAALKMLIQGNGITDLVVGGLVAIGLLISKRHPREKQQHVAPYQYLTEVIKEQRESLRMTFPLGLEA